MAIEEEARRASRAEEIDSPRAWLRVAAAFLGGAVPFGVLYSFGVFLKPIAAEFHASSVAASAFFSITATAYYSLGAFAGRLSDLFGPRLIVACGAATLGLGLSLTAFAQHLSFGYLTYGIGIGLGGACCYVPTLSAVGGWFVRRRNVALGIATAGIGVGTMVFPPLAAALIDRFGWRATDIILGLACALLLSLCALLVRAPPLARPTRGNAHPVRGLLRSGAFVTLYVSWVLATSALFVAVVFLPAFARAHGAGDVKAAALVSMIGAASVTGRLAFAPLGDRLGALPVFKLTVLMMALSYAIWLSSPSYEGLAAFAVILGLSYGSRFAALPAVLIEYFGLSGLGTTLGLFLTASGLAALLGPMLAGLAADLGGGYRGVILLPFGCGLLGFAALVPLRGRPR
jgi:MFS family permease